MLAQIAIARKMSVPAGVAWRAVSAFGGLDAWFPTIASCRVEGGHRYMALRRGGEITDRLVELDATARRLSYRRLKSPFPVASYTGTVEVFESFDAKAIVVWTVDFESSEQDSGPVAEMLRAGIGAGVEGMERDLRRLCARRAAGAAAGSGRSRGR